LSAWGLPSCWGVIDPSGAFHRTGGRLTKEQILQKDGVRELLSKAATTRQWIERSERGRSLVVATAYGTASEGQVGIVYYSEWLDDILRLSRRLFLERAGVLLLLIVAMGAVIWLFVRRNVAAPLSELLTGEYAASRGDLSERTWTDPHNEVTAVCTMCNYMVKKIEDREEELTAAEEPNSMASAVTEMGDGLAAVLRAGRWIETHGDLLTDDAKRQMTAIMRKERELLDMIPRLKRELQWMSSYEEEDPTETEGGD
jgi:signal transduction histidine kinase